MRHFIIILLALSLYACKSDNKPTEAKETITETDEKAMPHKSAQKVPIVSMEDFEKMAGQETDTLYAFNFWATWCKPCIEEMPYFEKLAGELTENKFKLVYVSIDNPKKIEKVRRFVNKKGIQNDVVVLDAGKPDEYITRIDESWEGAIPATLFVDNYNKTRLFYEREFSYDELKAIVLPLLPMDLDS